MSADEVAATEKRLIGAALQFRTVLDRVEVDPNDFQDNRHRALWVLMSQMRDGGREISPSSVLGGLSQIPKLDRTGIDGPFLHDLIQCAPFTAGEAEVIARDLANNAALARLGQVGQRALQLSTAGGSAIEYQDILSAELEAVTSGAQVDLEFIGDGLDSTLDEIENPKPVTPTPWRQLNRKMRGWRGGRLHVIGARPSIGKSLMLLQSAIPLAESGGTVLFHSLEMSKSELQQRAIAQMAEVPLGRLEGANPEDPDTNMTARDWDKVAGVMSRMSEMKIVIDDRSSVSVADVRAKARAVSRRGKLSAIFIDYLQLLQPPRHLFGRNRAEVVGDMSRSLKILAKELDVPVIVAVQLNRGSTQREDPRPTMADIRESGAIEQDSDIIILLHAADPAATDIDMFLVKQRQGGLGIAELTKQGHYARLIERPWTPHNAA